MCVLQDANVLEIIEEPEIPAPPVAVPPTPPETPPTPQPEKVVEPVSVVAADVDETKCSLSCGCWEVVKVQYHAL